jgi:beta-glucosidase
MNSEAAGTRIPEGFLWGAATSAYQIEGSPLADDGAPSIEHRFAHTSAIGNYHALTDIVPASHDEADVSAAQRVNAYVNTMYLDAIAHAEYPAEMIEWFGDAWPEVREGDLKTISTPLDSPGFSYYSHSVVADASSGNGDGGRQVEDLGAAGPLDVGTGRLLRVRALPPTKPTTGLGWEIVPEGLRRMLSWVSDRYDRPPIYIGEMGASFDDPVDEDGRVDDTERIAYIRHHVRAAHQAISDGVDLRGLFIWALMDTYEFNLGYTTKFGLIRVDYETQERTIKASGHWYRDVIAANGL